jgi:hypothetical protein
MVSKRSVANSRVVYFAAQVGTDPSSKWSFSKLESYFSVPDLWDCLISITAGVSLTCSHTILQTKKQQNQV